MFRIPIDDDSRNLVLALKPFLGTSQQRSIDIMIGFLDIFRPQGNEKINTEALIKLLDMLDEIKTPMPSPVDDDN